jgi:hypothetical protein
MPRNVIFILSGLIIAAVLGWVSASGTGADRREIRDPWPERLAPADEVSINEALSRLNGSALFPKPAVKSGQALGPDGQPISEGAGAGARAAGPFPDIRGVSILDGRPHVTLELASGDIKTIAEGETLESGWRLKSVDPTRIIAAYEDEEITRPIRDYAPGGE